MPRSTQSRESGIVNYFKTADLAIALVVLGLAKDAVHERQVRSAEAKARATGSVPAKVKPPKPAAAPPPAAAPRKRRKRRKAKVAPVVPAEPAYTEDDLNS